MGEKEQNTMIAKSLLLIYFGQVLVVLASLVLNYVADGTIRTTVTVAACVGFRLVELWVAAHLYKINRAYHMALYVVALDILCWVLALLGLSVYNFVPMCSAVCEVAAVFYFCKGTDQVRGHTTIAVVLPFVYLIFAAITFVTGYLVSVSQGVNNAVQGLGALACLAYALYMRTSAQAVAKKTD